MCELRPTHHVEPHKRVLLDLDLNLDDASPRPRPAPTSQPPEPAPPTASVDTACDTPATQSYDIPEAYVLVDKHEEDMVPQCTRSRVH